MIKVWETDGRTDRQTDGQKWLFAAKKVWIPIQWNHSWKAKNVSMKLQNLVYIHAPFFTNHFILSLIMGHLFWKATIFGGFYRGVPLTALSCKGTAVCGHSTRFSGISEDKLFFLLQFYTLWWLINVRPAQNINKFWFLLAVSETAAPVKYCGSVVKFSMAPINNTAYQWLGLSDFAHARWNGWAYK